MTANPATGSLLLTLPPDDPIDLLIDDLRIAGLEIVSRAMPAVQTMQTQSSTAAIVRRLMSTCNAKLHMATKGNIDIRLAVPAFYLLLAARNFRKQGPRLRDASWYQLAYWAFDSFFKLHEETTTTTASGAGSKGRLVG